MSISSKESVKENNYKNLLFYLNFAWNFGFWISVPLVLLTFLGLFLDNKLNTKPTFTLVGLVLGIITGIYTAIKEIKKVIK